MSTDDRLERSKKRLARHFDGNGCPECRRRSSTGAIKSFCDVGARLYREFVSALSERDQAKGAAA